jgi:chemotaxis protein CheD
MDPKQLMQRGIPVVHLKIGECVVLREESLVNTVLGSCVSATLYHPESGLAGMFHAMLPEAIPGRDEDMPCKYADAAVDVVYSHFLSRGVRPKSIQVKLFGGAFTIDPESKQHLREIVDVGAKNVAVARRVLRTHGLDILTENVLGSSGRKLIFHTGSGTVWMRYLPHIPPQHLPRRSPPRNVS